MTDALASTLPPGRHGLSKEFIAANQSTRLISGFAHSVRERGYCATTIANITACASVSRRTFYEHFGSKAEIANCLLVKELAKSISMDSGLGIYAIETLMKAVEDREAAERSMQLLEEAMARLDDLEHPAEEIARPMLVGQPSGVKRPRLSKDFLANSQRSRVVSALARLTTEKGYFKVTVSDIVKTAGVARNTFYDNFGSKDDAIRGMVKSVSEGLGEWTKGLSLNSGFGILVVELVAHFVGEDRAAMERQATEVRQVLGLIRSALAETREAD